ncbi:hypothetical protein RchiOBHm_Chr5g0060561 [Rosa chinensis]|uniref:Uncharacterized protein n=1 Tax=Rosa chinensis TaxID=74649 RepID=A0A2P6QHP8_ROSCH|nr:hypothetical protein RchiOBHm_Chr5g0060561 [Rosa chinensis]
MAWKDKLQDWCQTFVLARSIRRGSEQFWSNFGDSVKKETGFDLKDVNVKVGEYLGQAGEELKRGGTKLERFRTELVPEFVSWNQWERWKDIKSWEPKRVAALVFYVFIAVVSCQRIYVAI